MITACAIRTARFLAVFVSCWLAGLPWVSAHPHVFIEGGVDFVVDDSRNLAALDVTWHYDPFETLYLLSSIGIVPAPDGTLSPEDTAKLIAHLGAWPDDFDGAAHLSVDGEPLALSRPAAMQAEHRDGRLIVRFRRDLARPTATASHGFEVAFYEGTYYYAFSITRPPQIRGADGSCAVAVIPFNPSSQHASLQTTLAALGREETPEDTEIGALFADRVRMRCDAPSD